MLFCLIPMYIIGLLLYRQYGLKSDIHIIIAVYIVVVLSSSILRMRAVITLF